MLDGSAVVVAMEVVDQQVHRRYIPIYLAATPPFLPLNSIQRDEERGKKG